MGCWYKWYVAGVLATLLSGIPVVLAGGKILAEGTRDQFLDTTDRLIIKLREPDVAFDTALLQVLGTRAGMSLNRVRPMSWGAQVLKLPKLMSLAEAHTVAQRLRRDPQVAYAEPDQRVFARVVPNDTLFSSQWHFQSPSVEIAGTNLPAAWDITTGDAKLVIAVIDTGVLPHAELAGRMLPGYDFVTDAFIANDGDGRDADASDPGDWITAEDSAGNTAGGRFRNCTVDDSSWHGTHNAGIIAANTNNAQGVAGTTWVGKILPVRVLGKCGGFNSDVIDGARWAVGLAVPGVPMNPNPARILNQSLGNTGACSVFEQSAINEIVAAGGIIVVPAGNENASTANASPANCNGVIAVGALSRTGGKAFYSNFGPLVDITAPGGVQSGPSDPNGILSTLNTGATVPAADDYQYISGTSFSTSQISGIIGLMLAANPTLTFTQVLASLQTTVRPFPTGTGDDCAAGRCGPGIVNAAAAVNQVRQTVSITASDASAAELNLDPGSFTITRGGDISAPLTLNLGLSGTATSGSDYTALSTSVALAAGASTATLAVTPLDDSASEGGETIILTLGTSLAYLVTAPSSAAVVLADDEPAPQQSGGGGGGCVMNPSSSVDPGLPILVLIAVFSVLSRRRVTHRQTSGQRQG